MAEPLKIQLKGSLEGVEVLLNPEELTIGFLEDIQSAEVAPILDAISRVIIGGLPTGDGRQGLRKLTPAQFAALIEGINRAISIPKAGSTN